MSDYVRNKVVRLPFPKSILDKCKTDDPNDCEEYLTDLLGDLFENNKKHFTIAYTTNAYYLDWIFYHTYRDESGDFGSARYLTDSEYRTIKPYFEKIVPDVWQSRLRIVDYCYYNCSESPDYYDVEVEEEDYSEELL